MRPPTFRIFFFLSVCSLLFTGAVSCGKKTEVPPEAAQPTPLPKAQIPVAKLAGLSLNGQTPELLARQSGDPTLLEASDLSQFFQLFQADYFENVLKLAQAQIDSGKPLQGIILYFGPAPKKLALKCQQELGDSTCLIEPAAFDCNEALPRKDWNDEIYNKVCLGLGRVKAFQPRYLLAVFDGDNTMWYQDVSNAGVKRGVESGKIVWAEGKADLLGIYPPLEQRKDYKTKNNPYQYYEELYEKAGALFNYEFAALAFRGLSLNEAHTVFKEALGQKYRPTAFPEMVELLKYLHSQGVLSGVVSASPIFSVYPLVEGLQTGIPLENIEGLDVFVRNPADAAAPPVRLSRLLVQGKLNPASQLVERFQSYQDFLSVYGNWIIVDVDHVINARAGKAVAVRSIARRYVAKNNQNPGAPGNMLDIDDLRMLLIGGDNFAPGTDIPNPKGDRIAAAQEAGNDQGLSEALAFLEKAGTGFGGTDILFIRRYVLQPDGQAYPKKGGLEKFQAYVDQQRILRPDRIGSILVQPAITDVKAEGRTGGFLKETPKTPETQPMPESAPMATPKPVATPKPGATPLPTPKPAATPAPARPFGPLPPEAPPPMSPPVQATPKPVATPGAVTPALPPVAPIAPTVPSGPAPTKLEPLPPGPPSDAL